MPHLLETLTAVVSDLTRRHHLPDIIKLSPLQGDASARRYFRVNTSSYSMILMDCRALIDITTAFSSLTTSLIKQQIPAPHILAATPDRGLMLLEDFGDTTLLHDLTQHKTTSPYDKAVQLLVRLQCIPRSAFPTLPTYSHEKLMAECHVFPHWFLNRFLKLKLSTAQHYNLNLTFEYLINNALAQPSCFVHRDYHSRNLMTSPTGEPGVLDFQDAIRSCRVFQSRL